jgi:cytochrome c oxidase subunit 4
MSDQTHDHGPSHADEQAHDEQGHDEHHGSVGKFLAVFVALLVLTTISFVAGSSEAVMSNPAVGWTIMMAVSCAKALLVMMFFMHLIWEANWKYVLTIPASIMSVFLLLMLFPDVGNRTNRYTEERWLHAATPESTDHGAPADHDKSGAGH